MKRQVRNYSKILSKKYLKHQYYDLLQSINKIALKIGCSHSTVCKYMSIAFRKSYYE